MIFGGLSTGNEVCDKLGAIGLLFSMILYLTEEFHLDQVVALNILTISSGTCYLTPIIGGYIADAYLGRYVTLLISSFINLMVIPTILTVFWHKFYGIDHFLH